MSEQMREALQGLRAFMFRNVYHSEIALREHKKAEKIVEDLFAYYMTHPSEMEGEFLRLMEEGESVEKTVTDYIACMTDRFAVARFQKLFIPEAWSVV